jgi:hypothetical protein
VLGTTTYFSGNCDQRDAEISMEFMTSKVTVHPFYLDFDLSSAADNVKMSAPF